MALGLSLPELRRPVGVFPALGTPLAPTLDLDFIANIGYAQGQGKGLIQDLVTISGGAGGTVVGPSGLIVSARAPRFDYDPVSFACKGLLVEEQRTNLLTESEFRNGLVDAPDRFGLVSATTLSGFAGALAFGHDGATTSTAYKSNYTTVIGQSYFLSALVAMDDGLPPTLSNASAASSANSFALVVGNSAPDPNTASITSLDGGLYRVTIAWTATNASTKVGVVKYATNSARTFKVTGYCLEIGAFASSYIPTTTAAATRTADAASMVGASFASIWNDVEGTFAAECDFVAIPAVGAAAVSAYRDAASRYAIGRSVGGAFADEINFYEQLAGVDQAWLRRTGVASVGPIARVASAYRQDDFAHCVNGGPVQADTSGSVVPAVSTLYIGDLQGVSGKLNGHIRRLRYWPRRLSNGELQELTR